MKRPGWARRLGVGAARRALKIVSYLVPDGRREEWLEEWESELWHWWEGRTLRRGAAGFRSFRLIVGTIPHAAWERTQDWTPDKVLQDLRYAWRQIRRSPGFTTIAVVTLGLGIGANTLVFSLLNGLLLRPLPGIQQPEALVQLARIQQGHDFDRISYPNYVDIRDATQSLTGLVAHFESRLFVGRGVETAQVSAQIVSGNYFQVLGTSPALGRTFVPDDDVHGSNPVAVLSYRYWQREFGANPATVGQVLRIGGQPFEIVGIAGEGFVGTEITSAPIDLWVPLAAADIAQGRSDGRDRLATRGWSFLRMFGRVREGTQIDEVRAEMALIADRLRRGHPTVGMTGLAVVGGLGLVPVARDELESVGFVLVAAVVVVLLITCANLANLLLVRASARAREIAVRTAMGASRGRLVRQLLTESVMLSVAGGLVALLIAGWASQFLPSLLPTPVATDFGLDGRVFAFALIVALGTGVAFGILPAWRTSRPDLVAALKLTTPSQGGRRFSAHSFLVVVQVALSVVLLVSAGLLLRSVEQARRADPGFETRSVLVMSINVERAAYTREQGERFYDELLAQIQTLPGVAAAAISETIPIAHFPSGRGMFLNDDPIPAGQSPLVLRFNIVSPSFFETLGIPILRGRGFTEADDAESPLVMIVNEALAEQVWPGEDPVGKALYRPQVDGWLPLEVIGVARNAKMRSLRADAGPFFFTLFAQDYEPIMRLHVRAVGDPNAVTAAVLGRIRAMDEGLPVYGVSTLHERVVDSLGETTMSAFLITAFGGLALLLAAIGLYGTIAYTVSQRHRELGLRIALGARPGDVLAMVVRQGLTLGVGGVLIGLAGAVGVTRLIEGLLFGVTPTDPTTFGAIASLLVVVSLLASYVPARRATQVDPMTALRSE